MWLHGHEYFVLFFFFHLCLKLAGVKVVFIDGVCECVCGKWVSVMESVICACSFSPCGRVAASLLPVCCRCWKRYSRSSLNRQQDLSHGPPPPQLRLLDFLQKRKERKAGQHYDLKISKAGNVSSR